MLRVSQTLIVASGMVALAACGNDDALTGPSTGSVQIGFQVTGEDPDPDGVQVSLDGQSPLSISSGVSLAIHGVGEGTHSIQLTGLASNCVLEGPNPRSVLVSAGDTAEVSFRASCTALVGTLIVRTTTSGEDLDSDGYTTSVDGGNERAIDDSAPVSYAALSPGEHLLELIGIADNCSVAGDNPRNISVAADQSVTVTYTIECVPNVGRIRVRAQTTGADFDPDGYVAVIDSGLRTAQIGPNEETGFGSVSAGTHQVELTDVSSNCAVLGENPRQVAVALGESSETVFDVECRELRSLAYVLTEGHGVLVYDTRDHTLIDTLYPGQSVRWVVPRPHSDEVWVQVSDMTVILKTGDHSVVDEGPFGRPQFTSDGTRIFLRYGDRIDILDSESRAIIGSVSAYYGEKWAVSADGNFMFLSRLTPDGYPQVAVVDVYEDREVAVVPIGIPYPLPFAPQIRTEPSGRFVFIDTTDVDEDRYQWQVLEASTRTVVHELSCLDMQTLSFSHDGSLGVIACNEAAVIFFEMGSWQDPFGIAIGEVNSAAYTVDKTALYYTTNCCEIEVLDLLSGTTVAHHEHPFLVSGEIAITDLH